MVCCSNLLLLSQITPLFFFKLNILADLIMISAINKSAVGLIYALF